MKPASYWCSCIALRELYLASSCLNEPNLHLLHYCFCVVSNVVTKKYTLSFHNPSSLFQCWLQTQLCYHYLSFLHLWNYMFAGLLHITIYINFVSHMTTLRFTWSILTYIRSPHTLWIYLVQASKHKGMLPLCLNMEGQLEKETLMVKNVVTGWHHITHRSKMTHK